MRLAALYIESHDYLFKEPQTINFAGHYFYEFKKQQDSIIIYRRINPTFIDGFFDLTNLETQLTNINAIAGQNGAGKSGVLDIIRSEFIEHEYALPQSTSLFIVEDNRSEYPLLLRSDFHEVWLQLEPNEKGKSEKIKLDKGVKGKVRSIYYSPHFDYKYNVNFDDVDNHDISFDKLLEQDLKELNDKEAKESGFQYSPHQELLFKNALRQILFLNSDLVQNQKIFKDIFHLPEHNDPILYFRGYKEKEKEWNTPNAFRRGLKIVSEKTDQEISNWASIRQFKSKRVANQKEINQYILKRRVIQCLISLLYEQMEKNNAYLTEGKFAYQVFEEQVKNMDSFNTLILFLDYCEISSNRTKKGKKVFNVDNIKKLLNKIYEAIEKVEDKDDVENDNLRVSKEDAIEILKLQRLFIQDLQHYYYLLREDKNVLLSQTDKIDEFINFMPFEHRLSSGENALLNLFSRLYDFLHSNIIDTAYHGKHEHYILMLDEADLGFHPKWKRRFVKALSSTIPFFFNEMDNRPSVQIIFSTHDPLTLSDLPNTNVIYIDRKSYGQKSNILEFNDENRPSRTFGANISDLLAHSFFLEDSLIGDFATSKIKSVIHWLNSQDKNNAEINKKIIQTIDEPIVQRKLAEMFDSKMNENLSLKVIDDQIKKLNALRKKFEQ